MKNKLSKGRQEKKGEAPGRVLRVSSLYKSKILDIIFLKRKADVLVFYAFKQFKFCNFIAFSVGVQVYSFLINYTKIIIYMAL